MTFVHDEAQDIPELVIVSTQAMTDEAIARSQIPQRVSYGFHGIWVSLSAH